MGFQREEMRGSLTDNNDDDGEEYDEEEDEVLDLSPPESDGDGIQPVPPEALWAATPSPSSSAASDTIDSNDSSILLDLADEPDAAEKGDEGSEVETPHTRYAAQVREKAWRAAERQWQQRMGLAAADGLVPRTIAWIAARLCTATSLTSSTSSALLREQDSRDEAMGGGGGIVEARMAVYELYNNTVYDLLAPTDEIDGGDETSGIEDSGAHDGAAARPKWNKQLHRTAHLRSVSAERQRRWGPLMSAVDEAHLTRAAGVASARRDGGGDTNARRAVLPLQWLPTTHAHASTGEAPAAAVDGEGELLVTPYEEDVGLDPAGAFARLLGAVARRHERQTLRNAQSSRGHLFVRFSLFIRDDQHRSDRPTKRGGPSTLSLLPAQVYFCDVAAAGTGADLPTIGAGRVEGPEGVVEEALRRAALEETGHIQRAIAALGDVLRAMAQTPLPPVPASDSGSRQNHNPHLSQHTHGGGSKRKKRQDEGVQAVAARLAQWGAAGANTSTAPGAALVSSGLSTAVVRSTVPNPSPSSVSSPLLRPPGATTAPGAAASPRADTMYVPYRAHKLTQLLQPALSSGGTVLLLSCCGPCVLSESVLPLEPPAVVERRGRFYLSPASAATLRLRRRRRLGAAERALLYRAQAPQLMADLRASLSFASRCRRERQSQAVGEGVSGTLRLYARRRQAREEDEREENV